MPNADVSDRENLNEVVEKAWRAFRNAGTSASRADPAVPILFFGDLHGYRSSERVSKKREGGPVGVA